MSCVSGIFSFLSGRCPLVFFNYLIFREEWKKTGETLENIALFAHCMLDVG